MWLDVFTGFVSDYTVLFSTSTFLLRANHPNAQPLPCQCALMLEEHVVMLARRELLTTHWAALRSAAWAR